MAIEKDIICLANSIKKDPGRCVAGVEIDTCQWIRPVSDRTDGELRESHFKTVGGHVPTPPEIIRIYLDDPAPEAFQPENWKLADQEWILISETLAPKHFQVLNSVLQTGPELLGNQNRSVEAGNEVDDSLALVKPDNPTIRIKRRVTGSDQPRLNFELGGENYDLPITDPIWKQKAFDLVDSGEHSNLENLLESDCIPLLTVSLGTEFDGSHWKLIAGIIEVPEKHF